MIILGLRMKRVLIAGDSLTAGQLGASFVDILARKNMPYRMIAKGRGGDTLLGIRRRLLSHLTRHVPDIVIIEAGVNDLLLPWFRMRGGSWKKLADRLEASGSIPSTEISSFQSLYSETIATANQCVSFVIVTTITCLGEDLGSVLNQRREQYNEVIRHLSEKYNVHLADVGKVFNGILQIMQAPSDYLLNEYYSLYLDTFLTTTSTVIDFLSRQRRLALTVDGIHLNNRGAQVYAETILEQLPHVNKQN